MDMIRTDEEGFTLPTGERFLWLDCEMSMTVTVEVKPPNHEPVEFGNEFAGAIALDIFLMLLQVTANSQSPTRQ